MFFLNYLFALILFVLIYLLERLILFWCKKKPIWPLIDFSLLIRAITYSGLSLILLGVLHLVFKKINTINLLWLDTFVYILIGIIKPDRLFNQIKSKEKIKVKKHHILGGAFFAFILLECFVFNAKAYSGNKDTYQFNNFVTEGITSNGDVQEKKIILKSRQSINVPTNQNDYGNIYLHFNNDDINLWVNIYGKKNGTEDYVTLRKVQVDPAIDAYGYIALKGMDEISTIRIDFDIDDTRYLNIDSMPLIVIDKISFNTYFPFIANPLRLGGALILLLIGFNFVKLFARNPLKEELTIYQKLERIVLICGAIVFVWFVIQALINHSAYLIRYDRLYLGGDSSSNIYYQQLDAYIKGQLHLDVDVDPQLTALSNPYDPNARSGIYYLWDHAFYNGKYYCYYGHAPIYLVMLPVYWLTKYVPINLCVLQLGTLFSIFAFLLAAVQILKLFVKKTNNSILVLTLIAMTFGSLLLTNNSYEYGAAVYRIPYAYANGFLFLTIYLFIKSYQSEKFRFLYLIFAAISLVFIVLSRPLEAIYLILLLPLAIRMVSNDWKNKKRLLVNYLPALGIVIVGAVIVCVMNYVRFGSILEFGEHYQLTVNDCTKNHLSVQGILPTLFHYFIQPPHYDSTNQLLTYSDISISIESHSYIASSVGLVFIPVALFVVLMPFVFKKGDDISFWIFTIASPVVIFLVAFINYCFAGVCPRYLNDFVPWAALLGGLIALKAIEKGNGKHPVVPSLISVALMISVILTAQYHFIGWDGLRIGDFGGLLGMIKTVTNQYYM